MNIQSDFHKNKKRMKLSKSPCKNHQEPQNTDFSNIFDRIKKLKMKENVKASKEKSPKKMAFIPDQIMKSLLITMNKNTPLSLNNFNSINFIYQTYNKGINIVNQIKNNNNRNKNIENCVNKRKFLANYNPNISMYSTVLIEPSKNNNIYENFKNDEIFNINESFNNKENSSNFISSNNNFFKKNFSMKNIDSNHNTLNLKRKIKTKYKALNNKDFKYILKRNNSCKDENLKYEETKKIKNKLFNNKKNEVENNILNFALLPINIIIEKIKKIEKAPCSAINRNVKSNINKRHKINNDKENPIFLKMFTEKYEKEKENFNNILFDECIELRKKKFKLESFIKRFTNKHFVEKLYKAKEYALKKNFNQ